MAKSDIIGLVVLFATLGVGALVLQILNTLVVPLPGGGNVTGVVPTSLVDTYNTVVAFVGVGVILYAIWNYILAPITRGGEGGRP